MLVETRVSVGIAIRLRCRLRVGALFLPHGCQLGEVAIILLLQVKVLEGLAHDLLHAGITTVF